MNNMLMGILVVAGIMTASAYAVTSVSDVSSASTVSNQIDIEKKSESMNISFDGTNIRVENTGKYDSEIVMFRFYDESGTEIHRTIPPDATGRSFGEDNPIVKDNLLTSDDTYLQTHTPELFTLDDMGIDSLEGLTGEIVTKRGRVFPIVQENNSPYENSENGTSILDALGVYMVIENIITDGMVYFGSGDDPGKQTDIRQYVGIGSLDDWAIAITDDDKYETLVVSEFGTAYTYVSGSLVDTSESKPNILGYSTSRSISGTNSISITDDGIVISGTGVSILELNDYQNQNLFLSGDIDDGTVYIVTSDHDLINDSYGTYGFLTYSASIDPGSNSFSVTAGIDSIHTGVLSYTAHATSENNNGSCSGLASNSNIPGTIGEQVSTGRGYTDCLYTGVNQITTTLIKTNNADHYTITGDTTTPPVMYLGKYYWGDDVAYDQYNDNFDFEIYDTLPSIQLSSFSVSSFEQVLSFPTEQTYMYVNLNSGSITIKGEAFDPDSDVYLEIDGLLADIAYDISKNGITGVVGKTSSTGVISLLSNDVDFGISSSPGGILKLYPDSILYEDDFGIGMIDLYNGFSTMLSTSADDLLFIPQNYIRWVFPVAVEFEDVHIDDTYLDFLNNNYTKNDAVMIPVIPGASVLYATINGTDVEILMRDVATNTQITHVSEKSSTTSAHATSGAVYTTSNISTSTFLTASHTGTMSISLAINVGGSADFSMDSTYTGGFTSSQSCKWHGASSPSRTYSCSNYSTPNNINNISNIDTLTLEHQSQLTTALSNGQLSQISVELFIIKNMDIDGDTQTTLIYTSDSAQASITSTLSEAGYGAKNQVHVEYPQTSITEYVEVSVIAGDMVEFMIIVNLEASGASTPSSIDAAYSSYVQTTTEFGGGTISVGMS